MNFLLATSVSHSYSLDQSTFQLISQTHQLSEVVFSTRILFIIYLFILCVRRDVLKTRLQFDENGKSSREKSDGKEDRNFEDMVKQKNSFKVVFLKQDF